MVKNAILVLGDSTSMTIGAERLAYPFFIAQKRCWPESTALINCSLPGFVAANACAFFLKQWKKYPSVAAVIIHLGTCDAASSEAKMGRYTRIRQWHHRLKNTLNLRRKRVRLKNRLLHFEWNNFYNPSIEEPEKPEDYEYNLLRIVDACVRASVPVIMIKPKSNPLFPPGVGKGNFIFYKYWGIKDRISSHVSIEDSDFKEALAKQERGLYDEAKEKYKEILLNPRSLHANSEYSLMVVNNYAVAAGESGNLEEAEYLLNLLLKERGVRKEIVLYNLAQLYKKQGHLEKYRKYMQDSYESDSSLYRIRKPYLDAIDRIAARYPVGVGVLNLQSLIQNECYVDHCHPLSQGQELIAQHVFEHLKSLKVDMNGQCSAAVENILYNPELALGNGTEFYSYFRTYAPYSNKEITQWLENIRSNFIDDDAGNGQKMDTLQPKELSTAVSYFLKHPCFPSIETILNASPQYPADIGRFPEFFLVRHVIPYLRMHERESSLAGCFSKGVAILRKTEELFNILPPSVRPLVLEGDPVIDPELESQRCDAILKKIHQMLMAHLEKGHQVFERIKTAIFWYFREVLRFGSHSRTSMLYDRTQLEYIAEALAVAQVLNWKLSGDKAEEIQQLIVLLEDIVRIHETFCGRFFIENDCENLLKEYNDQLSEILENQKCRVGGSPRIHNDREVFYGD